MFKWCIFSNRDKGSIHTATKAHDCCRRQGRERRLVGGPHRKYCAAAASCRRFRSVIRRYRLKSRLVEILYRDAENSLVANSSYCSLTVTSKLLTWGVSACVILILRHCHRCCPGFGSNVDIFHRGTVCLGPSANVLRQVLACG